MGYFTLHDMRERGKQGQYWTAHSSASLTISDKRGQYWTLLSFLEAQEGHEVDVEVLVGKQERLPVRLIAVRVSKEEAQRRRERANKQITHPPKGCQAPLPGKRKLKASSGGASPSARKSVRRGCAWPTGPLC
jgi:hypothetical protein